MELSNTQRELLVAFFRLLCCSTWLMQCSKGINTACGIPSPTRPPWTKLGRDSPSRGTCETLRGCSHQQVWAPPRRNTCRIWHPWSTNPRNRRCTGLRPFTLQNPSIRSNEHIICLLAVFCKVKNHSDAAPALRVFWSHQPWQDAPSKLTVRSAASTKVSPSSANPTLPPAVSCTVSRGVRTVTACDN